MLNFYHTLGFKTYNIVGNHYHLHLGEGSHFTLEFVHQPQATLAQPASHGLDHFALLLPDCQSLAHVFKLLVDGNHNCFTGASNHGVSDSLHLCDPEGNGIELYHDYPKEQWITDNGKIVFISDKLNVEALYVKAECAEVLPTATRIGHLHFAVEGFAPFEAFFEQLGLEARDAALGTIRIFAWGDYHHHMAINTWSQTPAVSNSTGLMAYTILANNGLAPARYTDPHGHIVDVIN